MCKKIGVGVSGTRICTITYLSMNKPAHVDRMQSKIIVYCCFTNVFVGPRNLCVPAAMLVLAELHDVARYVSQLQVGVAIVPEVLQ